MDRSRYPHDWQQIAAQVKSAAGWKCQNCGAPHNAIIVRSCDHWDFYSGTGKPIRVVITVHHIGVPLPDGRPGDPDDKMDCRSENLVALCQRCHLIADLNNHITKRRRNRRIRLIQSGQMELL